MQFFTFFSVSFSVSSSFNVVIISMNDCSSVRALLTRPSRAPTLCLGSGTDAPIILDGWSGKVPCSTAA